MSYGAFEHGPSSFTVVVNRRVEPNERQKVLAMLPLLLLGLLAAACLISTAEWDGDAKEMSLSAIGASEEGEAQKAIAIAKSIGKDEVTAKNKPVDPKILKEVKKAEEEMKHETMTEEAYASMIQGKEAVSDDGSRTTKVAKANPDFADMKARKGAQLAGPKQQA